ncbi:pentatricopeptide repeat-containing protein At3g22670, mitochondrial [Phoenix dactylifera]|uniref:Pentatricopeptide repeat-containing protein At3g22670, mitochondrial n=1 Tax=Phoenix dactylifera TaxID=42345 RepID=A0A8B7CRK7_PHODC|nr:pentatricopeptide repeat-containing protein At3g22670, mitochondrial [Phoenix dactylifera]XP_008804968.1 pentatricopeptide repeat-containing protein At3g22670, mitochondrial [Phoenix dactylifera]
MAYCRRTLMACLQFGAINQRSSVLYELFNGFCTYSPELPDWFKFPQAEQSCVDSDDDFVLPTKLEFLEDSVSNRTHDCRTDVKVACHDSKNVDLDGISRILKSKYASPEAVFVALDHCSVKISEGFVNKILRRFNNDWVPAFGFFMWAGAQIGYKHSSDSYDVMVDILGKSKQFDVMWGLIDEMVQLGGLVSLTTMTKVMRRLAGACRWNEAIKMFHDIEKFGVKKDTLAMNILLDALCKERSIKHAIHAFLELRNEIPPNASSFNVIIHGWCKARKLEEAWQTMEEMRKFGFNPCVVTYTSLIEAYCMEKNFRMVDAILDEMHAHGCTPNVVTYTIIMHALGKAKETHEALKVCDKMRRDGCTPDTSFYNSLIYIVGRAGRLRDANDIYEEMCKNGISPNVNTYNTLISAACDHSQEESALKLLLKMEESSCKPNIKTYIPLLKLCCKKKWTKLLLYLLAYMCKKDVSLDLSTYTLLVHGLCQNGKLDQACLFFEEMVSKGFIPKENTYNIIIKALERGNMERVKAKVQQLMVQAQSTKQPGYQFMADYQIG